MKKALVQWLALSLALLAGALLPAGDPAAQEIKLKVSHFVPAAHMHHVTVIVPWAEEVKRRTNGRVEMTIYPGGSLCKPPQQYECAKSGIADIAWGVTGWTPGRFPMTSVLELPFIHRTASVGSQILADLWDGYLKKEYDDVHLLYLNASPTVQVNTHSKPVRTMEDLKGLKIRVSTAVQGDILGLLGATQVGIPAPQIYEAMSQRVIDGFTLTYEAILPWKLLEVSKYHTEVAMSSIVFAAFMNKAKYESLPADVRKVLDETTSPGSGYWKRVGEAWNRADAAARKVIVDRKSEIYVVPREERSRWREAVKGLDEKWAAALDARGLPGKPLVREARGLSAKYGEAD